MTDTAPSIGSLYVGASGFSYPSWRGGFYPAGSPPADFLGFYAERLPSVELNSTFYNLPSQATVERWAAATPPGFRFAVKANRRLLRGDIGLAPAFSSRLRALGPKLGPVRLVVERPRDDGWLHLLVESLDPELPIACDLRHESWDGVELPTGAVRVGALDGGPPFRYLRFREPPYADDAIDGLAEQIRPVLATGVDVYAYFRHEDEPSAPRYAALLRTKTAAEP
jgi:uncharacterized protein YecE (DUF72 family)